jgi:hypothetical protein
MNSSLTAEAETTVAFVTNTPLFLQQTTTTIRLLQENTISSSFYARSTTTTTRNHGLSIIGRCRMTNNDKNDDTFDHHNNSKEEDMELETNDVNTNMDDDDDKDEEASSDMNKSLDWVTLSELAELEERASKRNWDQLMLPNRIGEAIGNTLQFLAVLFLVSNYALPYFGYAYIPILDDAEDTTTMSRRPHRPRLTIGTLEERDFIMEIRKSTKEQQQQQQQ